MNHTAPPPYNDLPSYDDSVEKMKQKQKDEMEKMKPEKNFEMKKIKKEFEDANKKLI